MTQRLTKTEIINETADFYSADPLGRRSTENGRCVYNGPEGRYCAFSRCCTPEGRELLREHENIKASRALALLGEENLLQPKYQGHEGSFWNKVQGLHDITGHWGPQGLTKGGKEAVKRFLRMVTLNVNWRDRPCLASYIPEFVEVEGALVDLTKELPNEATV